MRNISIYRPSTVDEAIQILSVHGTEAGVYTPGAPSLLIRLKNRLKQAPTHLVDIKTISNLRYIQGRRDGKGPDRGHYETIGDGRFAAVCRRGIPDAGRRPST